MRQKEKKEDKLVNRLRCPPQQPRAREVAGKIITRAVMRSLAHATRTQEGNFLASGYSYVSLAFNASTCVASPALRAGDNCVLRQGKGISAYTRHNTICDAPYVTPATAPRISALSPTRATTTRAYATHVAVRRLMENALLSLIAVLRLSRRGFRVTFLTYGTARVEDLTRAFSRARRFVRGDNSSHLIASCDIA